MNKLRLYSLIVSICAAGYIWLAISFKSTVAGSKDTGLCLFKKITHIPCPSCGSTRLVLLLAKGDIRESLFLNPMGILLAIIMITLPLWILYDLIKRKESLYNFYNRSEFFLKRRWVAVPAILLLLINWIWNIYKGL